MADEDQVRVKVSFVSSVYSRGVMSSNWLIERQDLSGFERCLRHALNVMHPLEMLLQIHGGGSFRVYANSDPTTDEEVPLEAEYEISFNGSSCRKRLFKKHSVMLPTAKAEEMSLT